MVDAEVVKLSRRKFFIFGSSAGISAAGSAAGAEKLKPTPKQTEGPFYPIQAQKDKDFDLTQVEGKEGVAKGEQVSIIGQVVDTEGNPIEDATVDLWQANAEGKYHHPHDKNPAPKDENFQGWAIVPSGKEGGFKFKTIVPGAYPISKRHKRTPHIHFKVSKRGYVELTTQMYFPDQELNETDVILRRHPKEEQVMMIAKTDKEKADTLHYRVVLQKA